MADFCKQCSEFHFGFDAKDLANLGGENPEPLEEGRGYVVICEGCGPTLVNEEGECIVIDCMVDHNTGDMR